MSAATTLREHIERAFVGKTVRFADLPEPQGWIGEHVVRVESIELDIDGGDGRVPQFVVADLVLRCLSDNETLHIFDAPLNAVTMAEVEPCESCGTPEGTRHAKLCG